MDQAFIDILKQLVKEQGIAVLTDTKKCKALLADYTRNEYKKESRLLIQAVEAGVPKVIEGAQDLAACKKEKIRDLEEEYALSSAFAADIVDALAFVLREDTAKTVIETFTVAPSQLSASAPVKEKMTFGSGNVYEGETLNGIPHGKGKKTFENGDVYEGDFVNSVPNGKGKYTFVNYYGGTVYEGDFVDGDLIKGKITYADGDVKEGDFIHGNGFLWGKGKYTRANGDYQEGDFVMGNLHGKGKAVTADGSYEGDWVEGSPNGKGKKTYANGKVQEGNFKDGKFKGKGLFSK